MSATARMSPEREAELVRYFVEPGPVDGPGWTRYDRLRRDKLLQQAYILEEQRDGALERGRELLAALAAEREHTQQVEVPLSAAHGFALHVQSLGDSFIMLDGEAGAELYPSLQDAVNDVGLYDEHGEVVTPVALVPVTAWAGTDGRIGS